MRIIVRIHGGLSNQLFQYALGRALSSKTQKELFLTWVPFAKDPWEYCLPYFNIKGKMAKDSYLFGFVGLRKRQKLFDNLYHYTKRLKLHRVLFPFYHVEKAFHFDPNILEKNGGYFEGFWQTEKYFKNIEDDIRKEITLIKPLSGYSQKIMEMIRNSSAVSLHVRRGDYITRPDAAVFHGTCSLEYYKNAIEHISKKVSLPHFFLFSDDPEWTRENFKWLPFPFTCVKNPSEKNYEDLILMSSCKHHIIANSSFSWWGAWLNSRKDKIVIAPEKWFANAPKNDTRDLLPETWIKM